MNGMSVIIFGSLGALAILLLAVASVQRASIARFETEIRDLRHDMSCVRAEVITVGYNLEQVAALASIVRKEPAPAAWVKAAWGGAKGRK